MSFAMLLSEDNEFDEIKTVVRTRLDFFSDKIKQIIPV
jgi:hypothetical protein